MLVSVNLSFRASGISCGIWRVYLAKEKVKQLKDELEKWLNGKPLDLVLKTDE